jgi:hypothetical protein
MNANGSNKNEQAMSRRDVLHGAGAMVAVATTSHEALTSSARSAQPTPTPSHDPTDTYKLLGLWIALSTNPNFIDLNNESATVGRIAAETGATNDQVCQALQLVSQQKSAYLGVRAMFGDVAGIFNYTPGECPYFLSTLRPFSALPKPSNPAPVTSGTPYTCQRQAARKP